MAEILAEHSSAIEFQGLYAHCGNSYQGSNDDEVKQARDEAITKLDKVAQVIQDSGLRLLVKHQGTVFQKTPKMSHYNFFNFGIFQQLLSY